MKGHDVGATVAFADYTRDVDALRKQLADAQATVEALQRERDKLREATKVICGHCCEPMAIPSKAILQSQLSALQALVRDFIEAWDHDGEPNAVAYEGVVERARAALDALTPAGQRWTRNKPTEPGWYWMRTDK